MKALQHLCRLADQRKAERHHYVPSSCIPRSKYTDQDLKGLTQCIVDWFTLNNHFVSRISSTNTYRTRIHKFSSLPQLIELPELLAVVDGRAVFVQINYAKETLSHIQIRAIDELERAGACVCVVSTFQGFYDWFNSEFIIQPLDYDITK